MNLKQFRKNYSGAPISLQEMAESVIAEKSGLTEDGGAGELVATASNFLTARSVFERMLVAHGIEIG